MDKQLTSENLEELRVWLSMIKSYMKSGRIDHKLKQEWLGKEPVLVIEELIEVCESRNEFLTRLYDGMERLGYCEEDFIIEDQTSEEQNQIVCGCDTIIKVRHSYIVKKGTKV